MEYGHLVEAPIEIMLDDLVNHRHVCSVKKLLHVCPWIRLIFDLAGSHAFHQVEEHPPLVEILYATNAFNSISVPCASRMKLAGDTLELMRV